jgi:rhodanese-related sulfurtransferase
MYRKSIVLFFLILTLTLVACGGADTTTPSALLVPEISADSLPDVVDVQTVASIKESDDVYLIDVREQWEYDEGHIPGVTLIPMGQVSDRLDEIPTDKSVIVTCRTGNRSGQVTDYLRQVGFDNVHNMAGGIVAWEAEGFEIER